MKPKHIKLLLKVLTIAVATTLINQEVILAQPQEPITVETEDKTKIKPKVKFKNGDLDVGVNASTKPNINIGGEDGAEIKPKVKFKNGDLDVGVNGTLNEDIDIGGEDGVEVNPGTSFRNGRLKIDPKIDVGGLVDKGIDYASSTLFNFVSSELGVGNFLTDLNQDLSIIAGDIGTFLGLRGKEAEVGDINIPNIQSAKITFNEDLELSKFNDLFGSQTGSTFGTRDEMLQQWLKEVSQEYSENSALSLEGQSKIKAVNESASAAAAQSVTIAEDSSNQDVSQNILRNIANQNGIQQQIDAVAIAEMNNAKVDRSLSLQLDAETLNEASKLNTYNERIRNAENQAAQNSSFLITIPGKRE
jgi:hypothetical protein